MLIMADRTANTSQALFLILLRISNSTRDLFVYLLGLNGQQKKPSRMLRSLESCSSKALLLRCRSPCYRLGKEKMVSIRQNNQLSPDPERLLCFLTPTVEHHALLCALMSHWFQLFQSILDPALFPRILKSGSLQGGP